MKKIQIKTEFITLGQLLKYAGIINFGGDAKKFLSEEKVYVNNEEENRRGRKIYPKMIVKIQNEEFLVE